MLRAPLKLNILNYNLDIYSSKIWELVPPNIRNLETVAAFERAIETLWNLNLKLLNFRILNF